MVNLSLFIILLRVTSDLFSEALPLSLEASDAYAKASAAACGYEAKDKCPLSFFLPQRNTKYTQSYTRIYFCLLPSAYC